MVAMIGMSVMAPQSAECIQSPATPLSLHDMATNTRASYEAAIQGFSVLQGRPRWYP
jgi:hypothetical protein